MKIPICLVTGFLGAGKTTVLKNIVARYRNRRLVYLINEFSSKDVDGAVILDSAADVVSVFGGSIFCKCLVTQFIAKLQEMPRIYPDIEGLVIEASGMADPRVIEAMLVETRMDQIYALSTILAVVDPGSYMKLRHTLPNVIAQVQSADRIILNKIDLYDETLLRETELSLRSVNPAGEVLRTTRGAINYDIFSRHSEGMRGLVGEYALCKDPNYSSETVDFADEVDLRVLEKTIIEWKDDLYRVKGFVSSCGKHYYVDYSGVGVSIGEVEVKPRDLSLAIIYKGGSKKHFGGMKGLGLMLPRGDKAAKAEFLPA